MVIKNSDMVKEYRRDMRGGQGEIELTHIVKKEDLRNSRLLAFVNIPVDASIGDHEHIDEIEYYIILRGEGIVVDDGIEKRIQQGDVVVTGFGARHSIRNTGNIPLELLAIIITL